VEGENADLEHRSSYNLIVSSNSLRLGYPQGDYEQYPGWWTPTDFRGYPLTVALPLVPC